MLSLLELYLSSASPTFLDAQMAVLTHLNSQEGELWDLEHTQTWKKSRYPLEICSWKSPAHRRRDENSSRASSSSSLAHWEQTWCIHELHPCLVWLHIKIFFTPRGISMERRRRKWPKQRLFAWILIPWSPVSWEGQEACSGTLGTARPHLAQGQVGPTKGTVQKWCLNTGKEQSSSPGALESLLPWIPHSSTILPFSSFISPLMAPPGWNSPLSLPPGKQETKRKTCFTSLWRSLPSSFHSGLMGMRDAHFAQLWSKIIYTDQRYCSHKINLPNCYCPIFPFLSSWACININEMLKEMGEKKGRKKESLPEQIITTQS